MSVAFNDEGRPNGAVGSVARKPAPGEGKAVAGAVRLEPESRWWLSLGDCRRRDQLSVTHSKVLTSLAATH
jgi:hypothetical protein